MNRDIAQDLAGIVDAPDFRGESGELVERWVEEGIGVEAVEPILQFMEAHANVDFGAPGPLVHFVERFYRHGYEECLQRSLRRRPTPATVWMLNRVLNGTRSEPTRHELIEVLGSVLAHPRADQASIDLARRFLERSRTS